MNIKVPENVGGSDLRILPTTKPVYEGVVADMFLGKSGTGNPKVTVKYTITSEYDGPESKDKDFESTVGATVLETFSLQEQAIWRLNDFFKQVTGDRLPMGDFTEEEFAAMLKENLVGAELTLMLKTEITNKGNEMTVVEKREFIPRKKKGGKK